MLKTLLNDTLIENCLSVNNKTVHYKAKTLSTIIP